jgi:hypothetical protein
MVRRFLSLALLAVASACDVPTAPFPFPEQAVQFQPASLSLAATYAEWWAEVEKCAGQDGDFDSIAWYTVPSSGNVLLIDGREYSGAWYRAGNRIVLAENTLLWGAGVRHEMLHALLRDGSHSPHFFRDACADVVNCFGNACALP